MNKVFKVGLIGCGHIAETYFRAHKYFNNFKIIKCADVKSEVANKCAKTYRIQSVSCLLYTSPSPRDQRGSRMPSSA